VLQRHEVAAKILPSCLKRIVVPVIQAVNFIKFNALHFRFFIALCFEMKAESTQQLLLRQLRCLPEGKLLKRVHDLHENWAVIFTEQGKMEFKVLFRLDEKLNEIAYLADVFRLLNQLNNFLQGHN
jgi:hypothetical protein